MASPEVVWEGISSASEIVRWFAPEARVEPGVSGSYFVSWGPGMEGTSRITVWEPAHHLQLVEQRTFAGARQEGCMEPTDTVGEPARIVVDYYLEAKGGSTVLRLVHSGFGVTADWDNEFESTHYGWMMFVRNLRHAVTRHLRTPCRQAMLVIESALSAAETWNRDIAQADFSPPERSTSSSKAAISPGRPLRAKRSAVSSKWPIRPSTSGAPWSTPTTHFSASPAHRMR